MTSKIHVENKPPYVMLAVLFVGAFVSFLNNSLLNVALPSMMEDLRVDYATIQWLATGYMLVSGILIPASAFLIIRFTNRQLFIAAMAIFTLGTAMAAFAPNFSILLAGRMVQAAGSSVMGPLLMNVMLVSFPPHKRGTAMGVFGLVMITAPAIGPTLSGYIVEYYHWRFLFEMILPLAVISLVLAIWKSENVMESNKNATMDYWSVVLSTIGFGGLLYGVSMAGDLGWTNPLVLFPLLAGGIAVILFIIRQLNLQLPVLDLRTFHYPMFTLAFIIAVINVMAMFSGMILTPVYIQEVRGISPLHSGLMLLPGAIVMGIMSPITGRLFDRYGPKALSISGLAITAVATYLLSHLQQDSSYAYIIFIYTLRMFGMSMVSMPIITNGLNELPKELYPHGTAVNNTAQQVAGAIGTAIFVTIMNKVALSEGARLIGKTDPQAVSEAVKTSIEQQSLLAGIQYSFFIAFIVNIVALVLAFFVKRVDTGHKPIQKAKTIHKKVKQVPN